MKMTNATVPSPRRGLLAGIVCWSAAALSAMSFGISQEGFTGMSQLPAGDTSILWSALAVCFGLLFRHVYGRLRVRLSPGQIVWGLVFGLVNVLGNMLFAYDSWAMLKSLPVFLLMLAKAVGQSLPMMAAFGWLHHLLTCGCTGRQGDAGDPRGRFAGLIRFFRAHDCLCLTLLFVLCWLPYVLVFCPGTVCWDLGESAQMFFGMRPMNAWHGVFATWLFGSCVWLGRLFGSDNLGVLIYVLLQLWLLAYMAGRTVAFLRSLKLKPAFCFAVFLFFAVTPLWGGYVQFVGKDTLYTAALGLFTLRCAQLFLTRDEGKPAGLLCCAELFLFGLLACLIRANGLIVVLPAAVILTVFGLRGRNRLKAGGAALTAALAAVLFSSVLVPALGIGDDTGPSLYSPLYQQSARALRDHGDTVTPEEYAAIDGVLDARNLPELYEPWISDPVKYTFRYFGQPEEAYRQPLAAYRQAWFSMLKKYPLTYAEAFVAGNMSYYCFTPKLEGETFNNQAGMRLVFENYINQMGEDSRLVHITQPVPESIRLLAAAFARGWRRLPVLGLLYSCALYTWLLIGCALSLIRQKRRRLLWLMVPALLSLIVCMLGPVNDYFRYFLPIVAMTPLLLGLCAAPVGPEAGLQPQESRQADPQPAAGAELP